MQRYSSITSPDQPEGWKGRPRADSTGGWTGNLNIAAKIGIGLVAVTLGLVLSVLGCCAAAPHAVVDRLLFGSDSSFFPRGWNAVILEAQLGVLEELNLSAEDVGAVLGGNLRRLLG